VAEFLVSVHGVQGLFSVGLGADLSFCLSSTSPFYRSVQNWRLFEYF
jgi:hypothetical protein